MINVSFIMHGVMDVRQKRLLRAIGHQPGLHRQKLSVLPNKVRFNLFALAVKYGAVEEVSC
jgi:hypothetical protein